MDSQSITDSDSRFAQTKHTCKICDIKRLLLCTHPNNSKTPVLSETIKHHGPILPGELIYRTGEPSTSIYAITTGSVKTETITYEGFAQTTGFYLRGELFGCEALGESEHVYDAYAIERTWICELPLTSLENTWQQNPETIHELFRLTSRRSRTYLNLLKTRGRPAEQRIMEFLVDLSNRMQVRHQNSNAEIDLPMNKEDIANYLGITPETVSRGLRSLDKAGLIHSKGKTFSIASTDRQAI